MLRNAAFAAVMLVAVAMSAQPRFVTTVAGTPGVAGAQDGPASVATFQRPTWIDVVKESDVYDGSAVDDLYVIDRANQKIRKVSMGNVTTARILDFSREPVPFDFGGPFGGGILIEPPAAGCGYGIYDRGIFVVGSGAEQISLIAMRGDAYANRDDISPVIGSGVTGSADGTSTQAQFHTPTGIARSWVYPNFDSVRQRHVYIADTGNHTIRRVSYFLSFEACPQHRVIDTLAGTPGVMGWRDGESALFSSPRGLVGAPDGSVYVADSGNHVIRRVIPNGIVTTVAGEPGVRGSDDGPARQAHLDTPAGIDIDAAGNLYIADSGNHTIRMLTKEGMLVTIAGTPGIAGFRNGAAETSLFNGPVGIRLDANGTIFVADTSNNVIRRIDTSHDERRRVVRH